MKMVGREAAQKAQRGFGLRQDVVFAFRFSLFAFVVASASAQDAGKNWLAGGHVQDVGRFEQTTRVAYPWHGVDEQGLLRKAVAMPTANPFVTKSNQFSYAWLGTSASFVDMDGDGLPDLVSPDGNGIFWFWKNVGSAGSPAFGKGEAMPLLVDDQRSEFAPILAAGGKGGDDKVELSYAVRAARERVDERRKREMEKLEKKNERLPKDRQVSKKELEKQVEQLLPYDDEKPSSPTAVPTPEGRVMTSAAIPAGGLSCVLNTFRRLRAVASAGDWNGDKLPDFIVGDSGGTIYFAANSGQPGRPHFGHATRTGNAVPLKMVRIPGPPGRPPTFQPVEFMNYATPFVCDWDANGIPDLIVGEGTYSVNSIRWFPDAAAATPAKPPREEFLYVGDERTFLAPFAWDWDGDGDVDLFVCDHAGRLTVHRRQGAQLEDGQAMAIEGAGASLAYCAPQPCDWNADGTMDLIWGDPFGRILVALGKEKGGLAFSAPEAVRSRDEVTMVELPDSSRRGQSLTLAAVPARLKDGAGPTRNGGTASAERFYKNDGTSRVNSGGWPNNNNKAIYGLAPSWRADEPLPLEDQFNNDRAGNTGGKQGSWGIAPLPGDVWEVVNDVGAPGEGKTLLLRWHDATRNAVFKTRGPRLPQWTPGVSVFFSDGRPNPFAEHYTKKSIIVRFHMKLDGAFSRLDVKAETNWGPLGGNGKPPAEGGDFAHTMMTPPIGSWFEFSYTQKPDDKYERGLDAGLSIELLGEGEVRIRDVRITEGN